MERKAKSDTKCCGIDRHYWFFTILGGEVSKDKDLQLRYELVLFYLYYNNSRISIGRGRTFLSPEFLTPTVVESLSFPAQT